MVAHPAGKIAHQAIEDVESGLGLSGSLQVTMLVTIRDSLRALIEGDLSANDTYALLDGLFTAQERFTGEAQRYIGRITDRHVLGAGGLDEEEFGLRKEAIKLYLSRFVSQLTLLSPEIDELLRTLDGARISALVDQARPPTTSHRPTRPATRPPNGGLGSVPIGRGCSTGMCEPAPGHPPSTGCGPSRSTPLRH